MKTKQIAIMLLAVLLAVIIVQNSEVAVVRVLFWSVSMSMIILLLLTALAGFVIGWLTRQHMLDRKRDE